MKIITYTGLFPDSTRPNFGIFIYQRMVHVARRPGNSVVVVAPIPWAPRWFGGAKAARYRAIPRSETFGGLQVWHPRYFQIPKISMRVHGLLMFLGTYALMRRLVEAGADCIDSHFVYPDGFAAVVTGKLLQIPVVVSARGTDINLYPKFTGVRAMVKWTLHNANGVIAVCEALKQEMLTLGARPEKAMTISNGIDRERFFPEDRETARFRLGIYERRPVVVAVGSLVPVKGYHLLISAIAEMKRRGVECRLYIIGEGESRSSLQQLISSLKLGDDVMLCGVVPNQELRYWYSAADVSCLASSREGWANVLVEALACGTPVVATRIWGTPEVVASDDVGILVEQDPGSIANGLQMALQRKWDRKKIATFAGQRSWTDVAEQVENWLFACSVSAAPEARSETKGAPA